MSWSTLKESVWPSTARALVAPRVGARVRRENGPARKGFCETISLRASSTIWIASWAASSALRSTAAAGLTPALSRATVPAASRPPSVWTAEAGLGASLPFVPTGGRASCSVPPVVALPGCLCVGMAAVASLRRTEAAAGTVPSASRTASSRARSQVATSACPATDAASTAAGRFAAVNVSGQLAMALSSPMRPERASTSNSAALSCSVAGERAGTMRQMSSVSSCSHESARNLPRKTSGISRQTKAMMSGSALGTMRLPMMRRTLPSPRSRSRCSLSRCFASARQVWAVFGSRSRAWRSACQALTTQARKRSSKTTASKRPSEASVPTSSQLARRLVGTA